MYYKKICQFVKHLLVVLKLQFSSSNFNSRFHWRLFSSTLFGLYFCCTVAVYEFFFVLICRCLDQRSCFIIIISGFCSFVCFFVFLFLFFLLSIFICFYGWLVFDTADVPTKDGSVECGGKEEETVDVYSSAAPPGPLSPMLRTGTVSK